ncbi:acyltransferase [Streptosporangium sp. NPDC051023]|uniref:acyltransferase family protein n=1 Tax=Streptosporangium sp. NPDC051023 TaxID=3155410 RepID=UPI00344E0F42
MTSTQEVASGRLPSLTGLRVIAILFVFLTHGVALSVFADSAVEQRYSVLTGYGHMGELAVSTFFVLSGFVLTWMAKPTDRARLFWRRRFVRVLPSHILIALASLGMFVLAGETIRVGPALANLFLVQTWFPDDSMIWYQLNGPTWGLSVEVACYAAFPLLYRVIIKIRPSRLWFWALAAAFVVLMLPLLTQPLSGYAPGRVFPNQSWPQAWFLYFFPLPRSLEFVVGMILARIVKTRRWIGLGVLPATLLVAGVYMVLYLLPQEYGYAALYPLPMALLIGALATADLKGDATPLSSKPMVRLGDMSYAFYLLHIPVIFAVHAAFAGEWVGYANKYTREQWGTGVAILFIAGLYVLCWFLSWLLYTRVEVPIIRRWSMPRARPSAPERQRADAQPGGDRPAETGDLSPR